MANIIKTTDFVGRWRISQNSFNAIDFANNIAFFEPYYLEKLLGSWLYNQLVNDLDESGVPQTDKYIELVNGKTYVDCDGITQNYKGLKCLLKQLLFVELTIQNYYNSNVGNVKPMSENSVSLTNYENKKILIPISRDGVECYRKTIKFLNDDANTDTYFTDTEYCNWYPEQITPLSIISTTTYENKYYKIHKK